MPAFIDTPMRAGRSEPTMPDGKGHRLSGSGSIIVPVRRKWLWEIIMDEQRLAGAIPGAETLYRVEGEEDRVYAADVAIGVAMIKGTWRVHSRFAEEIEPRHLVLLGGADGPLGSSFGEGWIDLEPAEGGTHVTYAYQVLISGMVGKVGGKLLDSAADSLIKKFFNKLAKAARQDRIAARKAAAES